MTPDRLIIVYRRSLIALAVLCLFVLAWFDTAPNGHLRIHALFGKDSSFVSQVVPVQRTVVGRDGLTVIDEPVYFTTRYPRPFESAKALLTFANPTNRFLEWGPQTSPAETYERQGMNHPGLNALMSTDGWERAAVLEQDNTTVWQRRSSDYLYHSPEQFLAQLPDQEQTAYYGMHWPAPYLPDFKRKQQPTSQVIPVPLIGSHTLYAATDQDAISVHVEVLDLNRSAGADDALFQIKTWDGAVLSEQSLADDGNTTDDGRFGTLRSVDLVYTGLQKPAVLQVVFSGTDDLVFQRMGVIAPYLVVKGHVAIAGGPVAREALGAEPQGPISLITDSRALTFSTNHVESLQTVNLGQEQVMLERPFESVHYRVAATSRFLRSQGYRLSLEKGNIVIDGRGIFAFSGSAYFSPTPWVFDETVDADALQIDYVVARYAQPQSLGNGVFVQTADVDLSMVYAPNQSLRWQITSPAISSANPVVLKSITVDLISDPLTFANAGEKFKRFIDRL